MTSLNEEILNEDEDSMAIEADVDMAYYDPQPEESSSVVVTEPLIITIGRGKRKRAQRNMDEV